MRSEFFAGKVPSGMAGFPPSMVGVISGGNLNNTLGLSGVDNGTRPLMWSAEDHADRVVFDSRNEYIRKVYEATNVPLQLPARGAGSFMAIHQIAITPVGYQANSPVSYLFIKFATDPTYGPMIVNSGGTHVRMLTASVIDVMAQSHLIINVIEQYTGSSAPAQTVNLDIIAMRST